MRRRRKRLSAEGIELNLAAMLDMAFQLLMFFILTFNPSQVESQVAAYIPAPEPLTKPKTAKADETPESTGKSDALVVTVDGSAAGKIERLAIGSTVVEDIADLNANVHNAICRQETCDQIVVQVDAKLCYDELMQVVDICTQQKLPQGGTMSKIKLVELQAE